LSKNDETKKVVLVDKYPQMAQNFEEIKNRLLNLK